MRNIYIVNATQVVTSESHPEGLYSIVADFPKIFDSRSYPSADGNPNGDEEKALNMAKSAYLARLSTNYANANANRVMMVVTLERADGRTIMRECIGAFPDMTPVPEPTPEPEEVSEES
jgi:hypothetical protein